MEELITMPRIIRNFDSATEPLINAALADRFAIQHLAGPITAEYVGGDQTPIVLTWSCAATITVDQWEALLDAVEAGSLPLPDPTSSPTSNQAPLVEGAASAAYVTEPEEA